MLLDVQLGTLAMLSHHASEESVWLTKNARIIALVLITNVLTHASANVDRMLVVSPKITWPFAHVLRDIPVMQELLADSHALSQSLAIRDHCSLMLMQLS